jgi:hypothetical protein
VSAPHLVVGVPDPAREFIVELLRRVDTEVMNEEIGLIGPDSANARVVNSIGDVEVTVQAVTDRARAGEAATAP